MIERYSFIKAWRAKIFAKIEWKVITLESLDSTGTRVHVLSLETVL